MLREKAEYLRGLADGMQLSSNSDNNSKLLKAIIDCIGDIASTVDDNTDEIDTMNEDIDDIFETMDIYDEVLFDDEDNGEFDGDDCDGDCDCDCDSSIICDECGTEIELDELLKCPKCHKSIFGEHDDDEN